MFRKDLPHIILNIAPEEQDYTSRQGRGPATNTPQRNRKDHGEFVKQRLEELWREVEKKEEEGKSVALPVSDGVYLEFKGAEGYDLVTKSLENIRSGIRLSNVRTYKENGKEITKATIYVPKEKYPSFLSKVDKYLNEDTKYDKPKNAKLIDSIEDIRVAIINSFWNDSKKLIPKKGQHKWCEVWLRSDNNDIEVEKEFFNLCSKLGIEFRSDEVLKFPERKVVIVKADKEVLANIITSSPYIAEFRLAKETARFFVELDNKDQTDWVKHLLKRLNVASEATTAVCILDTGVNNGHELLQPIISDENCYTINDDWGTHDQAGHGTLMSGAVCYGDLQKCLDTNDEINISHTVESVKLIPGDGNHNEPHLYGALTQRGVYFAEIDSPERQRTVCMAITSEVCEEGKPTSWSAAIDALTSGVEDETRRLFVTAAGNIENDDCKNYPDSNITCSIKNPGQSWNTITVGAFTEKDVITLKSSYSALAKKGELSPYSRTSMVWGRNTWPVKPDIVFEGGNVAKDSTGFHCSLDDLSILSTAHEPTKRQFDVLYATSAATAQATWYTAQIQLRYPNLWPETIRALLVHSAEWTDSIVKQFYNSSISRKKNYQDLLRICGYGVPSLDKALYSASNSLTLISENGIQPFDKKDGRTITKDMHIHELPWPKDVLIGLPSDTMVKLKITLSYFIEPGPGEVGWKNKYRYPSHSLRFDLKSPNETKQEFIKRLNIAAREDGEDIETSAQTERWKLGPKSGRNLGSIHNDVWEGTAAEVSNCNLIGIYPVSGWWKERSHLDCWDKQTRYSLIVSLETPKTEIDLYTPVEIALKTSIEIKPTRQLKKN